jgi:hypothetical protein
MTLQRKICDHVYDSVSKSVWSFVSTVTYDTVWASVYDPVSDVAFGSIEDAVDNKLKTYDFTTKNK